jgi:sugar lactone lactonase YvrE
MKSDGILTIAICLLGSTIALGEGQASPAAAQVPLQGHQDPTEAALLAKCKTQLQHTQEGGAPGGLQGRGRVLGQGDGKRPQGPREYMVTEIPGVIAAGQRWKFIWEEMGNNGDGIVGSPDGGLFIAQSDNSKVVKLDSDGNASVVYTDTKHGGALSMSSRGTLFILERGLNPSVVELAPDQKTLADSYQGEPMVCIGGVLNDLVADSKGGVYFTMGGLYYADPTGRITRYGENLRTNGIILSPNEDILYVTNGTTLAGFDVQPAGSLTNQREFGKLEGGGVGDGSTIDAAGRVYVTSAPGVQVIGPDGKYLGLIPTPRAVISVAFSGPNKKELYILARGAKDAQGNEVRNAAQVYSISMIAQGFKKRAK